MTPDEFRALGHRMVDWIADYLASLERRPVTPPTQPGDVLAALPESLDGSAPGWDAVFRDLDTIITPNLTHWQHPGFFAYFPCNASGPGILGEIAGAGLNVNGMLWATSPAATELETRTLDWCADLFALPDFFKGNGVIQGTASEATLAALLAARRRDQQAEPAGDPPSELCVITSEQAHSSVTKAAMIAGIAAGPDDRRHVRLIRTHPDGRMDLDDLRRALESSPAPRPVMVAATVGTTGTGAVDDIAGIRRVLDEIHTDRPVWLHVDAAWLGSAAVCPEFRRVLGGVEHADSLCINPHKWLLTNFDCDLFWVRDRNALTDALSITPEYLRNQASDAGGVIDYRDWQIPLGRRMRALKLWFVLRHYGVDGLRAHIRRHVAWAEWFEQQIQRDDRFDLVTPRSAALVCFALRAGDDATRALLEKINTAGEIMLSHTAAPVDGRYTLRFVPGSPLTEFRHIVRAWEVISRAADAPPDQVRESSPKEPRS
ncbi:MAG TPA: aspartate aminotransferase family protein [Phycisphaerales bacterium]|nr:aspartate aminotransferase family protein [Phycisphaerales bacterium]